MATLNHISDTTQRLQIARNLQMHAWYLSVINKSRLFDHNAYELAVEQGLYKRSAQETLTAGSVNDLGQTGRAVVYSVVNRVTRKVDVVKTYDVAVFVKDFLPFDKLVLEYDTYNPNGELAGYFIITTPNVPENYLGITFDNAIATTYNGATTSGTELVEVLGKAQFSAGSDGTNGRLDRSNLTSIGSGHFLESAAAANYLQMVSAAARDGIVWTITDSYRTYDVQVRLAQTKGLYSAGGLAAYPGTSNHGWGLAVDLGSGANRSGTPQNNWLKANAGRYGFSTIAREPWHWQYKPTTFA